MKSGILKHPYFGDTRSQVSNNRQLIEFTTTAERNQDWFKKYSTFKNYDWKYCLFPLEVAEEPDEHFNNPIPKKYPPQKITYSYHVTSLKDQITTRAKNKAKFSESEILYITYSIAIAWREWKQFCRRNNMENYFFAISSAHVLFNLEGEIKLITPVSSPLQPPEIFYFAPENLPPNFETPTSWNKSITFSLGLIGAEMISLSLAQPFYEIKGNQVKFNFDEYSKRMKSSEQNVPKQIFNLILLMTDSNPWIRLKLGEFEALLAPYHENILEGRQENLNYEKSKASLLQYLKKKKNFVPLA